MCGNELGRLFYFLDFLWFVGFNADFRQIYNLIRESQKFVQIRYRVNLAEVSAEIS